MGILSRIKRRLPIVLAIVRRRFPARITHQSGQLDVNSFPTKNGFAEELREVE